MANLNVFPKCGHPRTRENSYEWREVARCKLCKNEKSRLDYEPRRAKVSRIWEKPLLETIWK